MTGMLLARGRLRLLGGALALFLGGLILAVARWNQAATDRAFVTAADAAVAAAATPARQETRIWVPAVGATPVRPGLPTRSDFLQRLREHKWRTMDGPAP